MGKEYFVGKAPFTKTYLNCFLTPETYHSIKTPKIYQNPTCQGI